MWPLQLGYTQVAGPTLMHLDIGSDVPQPLEELLTRHSSLQRLTHIGRQTCFHGATAWAYPSLVVIPGCRVVFVHSYATDWASIIRFRHQNLLLLGQRRGLACPRLRFYPLDRVEMARSRFSRGEKPSIRPACLRDLNPSPTIMWSRTSIPISLPA